MRIESKEALVSEVSRTPKAKTGGTLIRAEVVSICEVGGWAYELGANFYMSRTMAFIDLNDVRVFLTEVPISEGLTK